MTSRSILSLLLGSCLLFAACSSHSSQSIETPIFTYDPDIALTTIDGFRIQMTPRMAQAVANERGYKIDVRYGAMTLEDLSEQVLIGKSAKGTIYLVRFDSTSGLSYEVSLDFDFGKITGAKLEHVFYGSERTKAATIFASYKEKHTKLGLLRKSDKVEVYQYSPNRNARVTLSHLNGEYSSVSLSVHDINYALRATYDSYRIR